MGSQPVGAVPSRRIILEPGPEGTAVPLRPVEPAPTAPPPEPPPPVARARLSPEFIEQMTNPALREQNRLKATEANRVANRRLTTQQETFVRELLTDPRRNVAQALIRAGYAASTAYTEGTNYIRNPQIADAIRKGNQALFDRLEFTADQVHREYINIATVDVLDMFVPDPEDTRFYQVDIDQLRLIPGIGRAIREITISRTGNVQQVKVSFYDKLTALAQLSQISGLLQNKLELTGKDGKPLLTVGSLDAIAQKTFEILKERALAARQPRQIEAQVEENSEVQETE